MSWDVMILTREGTPQNFDNTAADWMPKQMGDAASVREAITAAVPGIDWSDPAWGRYDGGQFSIEFNFQAEGPVDGFTLHVRGGGNPLPAIVALCKANDWVAFDYSYGELIDLELPSCEAWLQFEQYRDKVVGRV